MGIKLAQGSADVIDPYVKRECWRCGGRYPEAQLTVEHFSGPPAAGYYAHPVCMEAGIEPPPEEEEEITVPDEVLTAARREFTCCCDEGFTQRGRVDPRCRHDDMEHALAAVLESREARAALWRFLEET